MRTLKCGCRWDGRDLRRCARHREAGSLGAEILGEGRGDGDMTHMREAYDEACHDVQAACARLDHTSGEDYEHALESEQDAVHDFRVAADALRAADELAANGEEEHRRSCLECGHENPPFTTCHECETEIARQALAAEKGAMMRTCETCADEPRSILEDCDCGTGLPAWKPKPEAQLAAKDAMIEKFVKAAWLGLRDICEETCPIDREYETDEDATWGSGENCSECIAGVAAMALRAVIVAAKEEK